MCALRALCIVTIVTLWLWRQGLLHNHVRTKTIMCALRAVYCWPLWRLIVTSRLVATWCHRLECPPGWSDHRVIYLKETRVRTTHAARKMLLCRLEAAKRHLNPGKIFALARISPRSIRSVCVFSPLTWLVIIDNSLCVCACVCVF